MKLILRNMLAMAALAIMSTGAFGSEKLTLADLREEVLNENLDIKIQYEKYYQSQRNVKNNLGDFLPSLNPQLLFWNTTYGILYSVTPTPQSWFSYQGSQEMAIAEKYVTESIKLNILRDLTLSFVNIKHQEQLMKSLRNEEELLVNDYEEALRREELGIGDPAVTFSKSRDLMQHRQEILMLDQAVAIQKKGLMQALNKSTTEDIELADLPSLESGMIPASAEEAIYLAVNNAPEVIANRFMAEGSKYMVRGAKWSFISFSGIGFGYPSQVNIEQSRAREIELQGEQLINKIENQVALAYEQLEIIQDRIELQESIVMETEIAHERNVDLYQGDQIPYADLIGSERSIHAEKRALVKLEMEQFVQVAKLKRLLGQDATKNEIDEAVIASAKLDVNVHTYSSGRKKVSVNLESAPELKDQIVSVIYGGDIFDYRIQNYTGNFYLYTKVAMAGEKSVNAKVLLKNGRTLTLAESVSL